MRNMKTKLICIVTAALLLTAGFPGVTGPVYADSASGWDEMSFEAQNNYRIFDIDSGLPFLGYMAVAQTPSAS